MKSTLDLRPVYHRIEPRIRSHVLICWLALLLVRIAENRTGATWNTIAATMQRLHEITLAGPAGILVQSTDPTHEQSALLRAGNVPPPARLMRANTASPA